MDAVFNLSKHIKSLSGSVLQILRDVGATTLTGKKPTENIRRDGTGQIKRDRKRGMEARVETRTVRNNSKINYST